MGCERIALALLAIAGLAAPAAASVALTGGRTVDWASIVAAFVVSTVLAILFVVLFGGGRLPSFGAVLLLSLFWLIKWSLWLLTVLVIVQAVLSWVNPYAPIAPTIDALMKPPTCDGSSAAARVTPSMLMTSLSASGSALQL